MSGSNRPRTIKLHCSSLAKAVTFVAWEEHRLDLGSIARAFGLDPSTLKLNGHFISRGVDLVSTSVTWRSLLSFFSSKGLSTGVDDTDALVVDGKLCKVGSKRACEPQHAISRVHDESEHGDVGTSRKTPIEDVNLLKNKKLKDSNSEKDHKENRCNTPVLKRRHMLEDFCLLKRLRINETNLDFEGRGSGQSNTILCLPCTSNYYLNNNLKRSREEEVIVAASCKRIR